MGEQACVSDRNAGWTTDIYEGQGWSLPHSRVGIDLTRLLSTTLIQSTGFQLGVITTFIQIVQEALLLSGSPHRRLDR
jgi:hypothetical protein